jgi:ADP-ribose pyrophosphatase YjhB (NUDIX family)
MIAARRASPFTIAVGLGPTQRAVLRCMADGCARSVAEAATHAGLSVGQTRNAMSTLHRHGYTTPAPPRKWVIAAEGHTAIDILRAHDFLEIQRQRTRDPFGESGPGPTLPVELASFEQKRSIDVHVLLMHEERVVLTREGPGWQLPRGRLATTESATKAAVRTAYDAVGVIIEPGHLTCVHTLHTNGIDTEDRVGLFFRTWQWSGEPTNRRPESCSDVRWFEVTRLPDTLGAYPAAGIAGYRGGAPFGEHGFPSAAKTLTA